MNKIYLIFILTSLSLTCFAQLDDKEVKPYEEKAIEEIREFATKMIQTGRWDDEEDFFTDPRMEFTADTMRIERTIHWYEEAGNYSSLAMMQSKRWKMQEYDKLLNKYYKRLMGKLTDEDKIKIRDAQRLWLKYRDSEAEINNKMVMHNEYMGGGTMWPIVAISRNLDIIRERVISLYDLTTIF